jgi:hypothetical protein
VGYLYFKQEKSLSPNADPWYFCSVCGIWNNPFDYHDPKEFEEQKTRNICKSCKGKDAKTDKKLPYKET